MIYGRIAWKTWQYGFFLFGESGAGKRFCKAFVSQEDIFEQHKIIKNNHKNEILSLWKTLY